MYINKKPFLMILCILCSALFISCYDAFMFPDYGGQTKDVTFSISGIVDYKDSVILLSETEGANIYYTTDGTKPTNLSTLYTKPITIDKDMTINAIAEKNNCPSSNITSSTYILNKYTITYFCDDQESIEPKTGFLKGDKIKESDLPTLTKLNSRFLGWYNGKTKISVGDTINCNLYLIAKWESNKLPENDNTDTIPPSDIKNFNVNGKNGKALLTWDNPNDSDLFGVEISMEPKDGSLLNPIILKKEVSSFLIGDLSNDTSYVFTIKSFDTSLNYSNGVTKKVLIYSDSEITENIPKDVSNLTISSENKNAILTWKNPNDKSIQGIQITMTPAEGFLASPICLGPDITSFKISDLKVNQNYSFLVKTFDSKLNYSNGQIVSITPKEPTPIEEYPEVRNLSFKAVNGKLLLKWDDPIKNDCFSFIITNSTGNTERPQKINYEKDNLFVMTGFENDKEYTLNIAVNYYGGITTKGIDFTFTPKASSDITPPQPLKNLKIIDINDNTAALIWDSPIENNIEGYALSFNSCVYTFFIDKYKTYLVFDKALVNFENQPSIRISTIDSNINISTNTFSYGKEIPLEDDSFLHQDITKVAPLESDSLGLQGQYILFGDYPQTLKHENISIDEKHSYRINNFECYKGSDNCYYVKDNGTFYKLEPIKWRVITDNYNGGTLLLSEKILSFSSFYDSIDQGLRTINNKTVYYNEFEYSYVRAFLNGLKGKDYPSGFDYGFIDTAFTPIAVSKILQTTIDNSSSQVFGINEEISEFHYEYNFNNTKDKVFLLSKKEITDANLGFGPHMATGKNSGRIKVATDYALAKYEQLSLSYSTQGEWMLRSGASGKYSDVGYCGSDGTTFGHRDTTTVLGIAPAIIVSNELIPKQ